MVSSCELIRCCICDRCAGETSPEYAANELERDTFVEPFIDDVSLEPLRLFLEPDPIFARQAITMKMASPIAWTPARVKK